MTTDAVPPEIVDRLLGAMDQTPFLAACGLVLDEVGPDRVVGHIELGPQHHQPFGIVHGGVYTAAVESIGSVAGSLAVIDDGLTVVGVNNSTHFVTAMSEGRVDVVATPIVQGRTQQLWNVDITRSADGRLVATGQLRLQNVERRR
jgi:1,4-dihydroxy-2-naphthoyl-CoA hydrolase